MFAFIVAASKSSVHICLSFVIMCIFCLSFVIMCIFCLSFAIMCIFSM